MSRDDPPSPPPVHVDTRGLLCPLPLLYAARKLADLPVGGRLEVIGTDRGMLEDFPEFCRERGHRLLALEETDDGEIRVELEKAVPT